MESTPLDRSLLLDFYGDLLTEKQRQYCDLHWNEDYSLSEIAQLGGLTRQGVWDILRRAETSLQDIETKTGLVRRHLERRGQIQALRRDLAPLLPDDERGRALLARLDDLE
ncbi:MAG: DNA-binding protein [Oscillospiraceae bacterium]|nr:DNA-binding protein [Oscillospiraceae bacterium]MCD8117836.1 DNA-binding protein [Oscillospiraceae bacterium]